MNHFRFASSASVGELIVNFNNPGFSHRFKLQHWIFNPFLLSRLLLKKNIVYHQKWSYFVSAGRSLFGGADPNAPNYSVIDTDYTSYSVVYMCRPIAGIFKKGAEAKSCLTHCLHLSFLNQNPCGSLQGMRYPLTQRLRQLWSKLTEKSTLKKMEPLTCVTTRVMRTNNLPLEKLSKTSQTGCEALP